MKKIKIIIFGVLLLIPLLVSNRALALTEVEIVQVQIQTQGTAQNTQSSQLGLIKSADDLVRRLASMGDIVIYLLVALAVIFLVWNVVWYIIRPADLKGKAEAGLNILWGIAGLAIIVSIWGLVNILLGTFNTDNNNLPKDRLPKADFITGR